MSIYTFTCMHSSFPGRSCLQFLIAFCMQKRRGKALEKQSRAWHQVDMRGAVTDCSNSQTLALISLDSTEQRTVLTLSFECYSFRFSVKILQEELQDSLLGTTTPRVYFHVYLTSCTWLFLQGRFCSIFDHSMRSKTEGENSLGTRLFIRSACMLGSGSKTTCMHACMIMYFLYPHACMHGCRNFSNLITAWYIPSQMDLLIEHIELIEHI